MSTDTKSAPVGLRVAKGLVGAVPWVGSALSETLDAAQEKRRERKAAEKRANFITVMRELWQAAGDRKADPSWYRKKLEDPDVEDQLFETFASMSQTTSRSSRLSLACLVSTYIANGRSTDNEFRAFGSFIVGASDLTILAASWISAELLKVVSDTTTALVLDARSDHLSVEVFSMNSSNTLVCSSVDARLRDEALRNCIIELKRSRLALENPSGYDMLSGPSVCLVTTDLLPSMLALGACLIVAPDLPDELFTAINEAGIEEITVSDLHIRIQECIPGGVGLSELRKAIDVLESSGRIVVYRDGGKATALSLNRDSVHV